MLLDRRHRLMSQFSSCSLSSLSSSLFASSSSSSYLMVLARYLFVVPILSPLPSSPVPLAAQPCASILLLSSCIMRLSAIRALNLRARAYTLLLFGMQIAERRSRTRRPALALGCVYGTCAGAEPDVRPRLLPMSRRV